MCAQNKTVFTFQKSKRILILRAEECLVSKKSKLQHISQRLLRELPIFKENFLNLIEAHILLLLSSLCKKVLFRNPVATRIFAHQLLNVSETPQEN